MENFELPMSMLTLYSNPGQQPYFCRLLTTHVTVSTCFNIKEGTTFVGSD